MCGPFGFGALVMSALLSATAMDVLYGEDVPLLPNGEPQITVGIATGEDCITVRAQGGLTVDYYDAGRMKRSTVPPGVAVDVRVKNSTPARRVYDVDMGGVVPRTEAQRAKLLGRYGRSGVLNLRTIEEGVALPFPGDVLDNREERLVLPWPSSQEAAHSRSAVGRTFGLRAVVKERLVDRPWAELAISSSAAPLGFAASFVRFVPLNDSVLEVVNVEFARGYAWHGRANRSYHGDVYVVVDANGTLAAVNIVGAETFLAGVVPAEIYSSAPPAALRAQAVAARNALLAKLGKRHKTDPYKVCSEQHCQVYAGITKEDPRTTAAVKQTRGQVLFYRGNLVDAVYSASCGGYTENNEVVWGETPNPALRGRPDFDLTDPGLRPFMMGLNANNVEAFMRLMPASYCAQASPPRADKVRWEKIFGGRDLEAIVATTNPHLGRLLDVQVGGRGPGGRVTSLKLIGTAATATIQRELAIRTLFANLNSAAFALKVEHNGEGAVKQVTFTGSGWGHGVGLCQLGAMGRAQQGQDYREILGYYYNGATLRHLYP